MVDDLFIATSPNASMENWFMPKTAANPTIPMIGAAAPNFGASNPLNPDAGSGNWMDLFGGLDGTKMALGGLTGLANAFMSMQQYGIAKKTLSENQRQFNLNYNAQRDTTNTALRDRQAARVASNPGAYQSVDDYMRQNAIK